MHSRTLRKLIVPTIAAVVLAFPASSAAAFSISIPRIHLTAPLSYRTLDNGPMIYYQDKDTLGIAGHRVTHTRPFYYINELKPGNRIVIVYNGHRNIFHVVKIRILSPDQVRNALKWKGLVLSACHPRHYATYRIVVFAR
jgi:LPXTG-site transpeptidase (sortase) family protein